MRYPAVAGRFYASKEKALRHEIEQSFTSRIGPGDVPVLKQGGRGSIIGGVVPHAGYMFSGPVAAHVYSAIAKEGFPETFVIIGPDGGRLYKWIGPEGDAPPYLELASST